MKKLIILSLILCLVLLPTAVRAADTSEILAQGDKGSDVVRVQLRLMDLGYYLYKPSGSFGAVTARAVREFQAASGIMADGSIGAETANALFARGALRSEFASTIPIAYGAQSRLTVTGQAAKWEDISGLLIIGDSYTITNCESKESFELIFLGGENHAEMGLPERITEQRRISAILNSWLGESDFYKLAVTVTISGSPVAASLEWNGEKACVYFTGSGSHVLGLTDVEHEQGCIRAAGG